MPLVQDIIQGTVGRISELREIGNGNYVLNLSVAVTPRKKVNDEWVDDTTIWTEVTLWGETAKNFANSAVKKGTAVLILGNRKARVAQAYINKNGVEVPERIEQFINATEIAVCINNYQFVPGIDKVVRDNNRYQNQQQSQPQQSQSQQSQSRPQYSQNQNPAPDFTTQIDPIFSETDPTSISEDDIFGDF